MGREVPSSQPPDSTKAKAPASEDEQELSDYVKRNLLRTLVALLALAAGLAIFGKVFDKELLAAAEHVQQALGAWGLLGVVFITDAIFSPVPPDVVLVVVANSALHKQWATLLPAIGLVSALAGNVGWFIGAWGARIRFLAPIIAKVRKRHEAMIKRYDRWAVVLGAVTPLPFSVICITAGALGMKLRRLSPVTLLRIPRFLVFYWVIVMSTSM